MDKLLGVPGQVGSEQGCAHHLECESHHRLVDIDDRAIEWLPAPDQPLDGIRHVPGHEIEGPPVEGRLDNWALHAPGLGVGREQPLTCDEGERGVLQGPLAVGARVGHEHPAHGLRIGYEVGRGLRDRKLHDRSVRRAHRRQESQRISPDVADRPEHLPARRARRRRRRGTSHRHVVILSAAHLHCLGGVGSWFRIAVVRGARARRRRARTPHGPRRSPTDARPRPRAGSPGSSGHRRRSRRRPSAQTTLGTPRVLHARSLPA